ncbi:rhamnogalacturonan acetylesterase [Mycena floridula]|nr:rhamnogalacturonan acetylesterase [Mycena floridula]
MLAAIALSLLSIFSLAKRWGVSLPQFLNITVVNDAVGGESARSYSDEGRFTTLAAQMKKGDFVIIEFGHNDAHANPDNGKQDAVGDGYNITAIVTTANGSSILIHSFAFYIENFIDAVVAKGKPQALYLDSLKRWELGGIPIISSSTPDNIPDANGIISLDGGRFQTYAASIGTRKGIAYVDHYSYTAQAYNKLGQGIVSTYYPIDHLHTSPLRLSSEDYFAEQTVVCNAEKNTYVTWS